jgi:predicted flap endonuclease-1-like 5' DNA nuclease
MAEERRGAAGHVKNDLAALKGIGPKYAEMLKSCGVDSIKALQHRSARHLKEMIEKRHANVIGLSEHQCQTWIDEAKAFYPRKAKVPETPGGSGGAGEDRTVRYDAAAPTPAHGPSGPGRA